ncbi:PREDICTED: uncharacterized protein LOC108543838 [Rhinopithecus bieti]|uniref:uncharacterized protein LOC108543838 n=1 Tax=Rhinopithecus bieti TaxID=61621 RepID=UPI00083BAC2B|nr:PREDICTED: uncharacterized protein LOC108543838 [Rhinopithecus bieti]
MTRPAAGGPEGAERQCAGGRGAAHSTPTRLRPAAGLMRPPSATGRRRSDSAVIGRKLAQSKSRQRQRPAPEWSLGGGLRACRALIGPLVSGRALSGRPGGGGPLRSLNWASACAVRTVPAQQQQQQQQRILQALYPPKLRHGRAALWAPVETRVRYGADGLGLRAVWLSAPGAGRRGSWSVPSARRGQLLVGASRCPSSHVPARSAPPAPFQAALGSFNPHSARPLRLRRSLPESSAPGQDPKACLGAYPGCPSLSGGFPPPGSHFPSRTRAPKQHLCSRVAPPRTSPERAGMGRADPDHSPRPRQGHWDLIPHHPGGTEASRNWEGDLKPVVLTSTPWLREEDEPEV